jgi:hypothetical protein
LRERRFADARDVLDQQVAPREQAGQRELEGTLLAHDDLRELLHDDGEAMRGRDVVGCGADGHFRYQGSGIGCQ